MVRMDGWFWFEVVRRNPGRLTVLGLMLFTEIRKRLMSSDSEGSVNAQEQLGLPPGGGSSGDLRLQARAPQDVGRADS